MSKARQAMAIDHEADARILVRSQRMVSVGEFRASSSVFLRMYRA